MRERKDVGLLVVGGYWRRGSSGSGGLVEVRNGKEVVEGWGMGELGAVRMGD